MRGRRLCPPALFVAKARNGVNQAIYDSKRSLAESANWQECGQRSAATDNREPVTRGGPWRRLGASPRLFGMGRLPR